MRALTAILALVLAACSDAPLDPEQAYARELQAARDSARASLPTFWQRFTEPGENDYDFSLKASFPRRDGQPGAEEAWVEHVARAPDKIVGELAVAPRYLGNLTEGAIVEFQENQIVDWAFFSGEKLLGHYTTRVMLPQLDSTQQEWLRAMLSTNPLGDTQ